MKVSGASKKKEANKGGEEFLLTGDPPPSDAFPAGEQNVAVRNEGAQRGNIQTEQSPARVLGPRDAPWAEMSVNNHHGGETCSIGLNRA